MLPSTVGELKKVLEQLPDDMPFELEIDCFEPIYDISLNEELRYGQKQLVLKVVMGS